MRQITRRTLLLGSAGGLLIAPWAIDACIGQQNTARPRELNPSAQEWATIKAVSNVFEVGNPEPAYGYVEALGDGRGYTVTQYGFCTYNDEVSSIIERIVSSRPSTPLRQFLPYLPAADPEIAREPMTRFPHAWQAEAARGTALAEACERESDIRIAAPALHYAQELQLTTPIGLCIVYDTVLQHGQAEDGDSLQAIIGRTRRVLSSGYSEREFLMRFLEVRRDVLLAPASEETRDAWSAATGRIDALRNILSSNPDLQRPVAVKAASIDETIN